MEETKSEISREQNLSNGRKKWEKRTRERTEGRGNKEEKK